MIATISPFNTVINALKRIIHRHPQAKEKGSVEAYDLWAESYDTQPGNLMLDMDEAVFAELVSEIDLTGKQIADIGCGTGRHWPLMYKRNPEGITGFDVSAGMLKRLEQKFPLAQTNQITDNLFSDVRNASYDVIVST